MQRIPTTDLIEIEISKRTVIKDFYDKYSPLLDSQAARYISIEERKDVTHDFIIDKICIKTIEEIQEIIQKGAGYIINMHRYYIIDYIRKRNKGPQIKEINELIEIPDTDNRSMIDEETIISIRKDITTISNDLNGLIIEKILKGFTRNEIVEMLGISRSMIDTRIHRMKHDTQIVAIISRILE